MLDPNILRPESQRKVGGRPHQVRGPEGTMPDPNILWPESQQKVEGRPWGCWGRHRAGTFQGAGACSRTRSPCGATPSPAATLGALRVQDAGGREAFTAPDAEWKAQSPHSTRGAVAGCWQVEGVPREPRGYMEAQDRLSDRTYGARSRQPARARLSWSPGCLAGREVCRAQGGCRGGLLWSPSPPLDSSIHNVPAEPGSTFGESVRQAERDQLLT